MAGTSEIEQVADQFVEWLVDRNTASYRLATVKVFLEYNHPHLLDRVQEVYDTVPKYMAQWSLA